MRQQSALLEALLDAFSQKAGKEEADTEIIQETEWTNLQKALCEKQRGHLLISRTAETALKALEMAEMDVSLHGPEDLRGFPALLTSPLMSMTQGQWRHVWLLDGEICAGEAERWHARLPKAVVHILPQTEALSRAALTIDAGDPAYRTLYKALRSGAFRTLSQTAEASGLTEIQTRAGLHAFRQLGLIEYSESPFRYALLPAQKCSLGDSPVLSALRRLHERRM